MHAWAAAYADARFSTQWTTGRQHTQHQGGVLLRSIWTWLNVYCSTQSMMQQRQLQRMRAQSSRQHRAQHMASASGLHSTQHDLPSNGICCKHTDALQFPVSPVSDLDHNALVLVPAGKPP